MDATIFALYIVAIAALICLSAFFSMSETAFTSVNEIKLKKLANEGNQRAVRTLKIMEDYDKFITTILIGNNLVNIAATSIATIIFAVMLGADTGALATTVIMTLIVLMFGEITPKSFAKRNPEAICMRICNVIYWVEVVLSPLSFLFAQLTKLVGKGEDKTITEDELEVMIDEIQTEGVLEKRESELIKSAMKLDDIEIADVYTPRVDVVAIDVESDLDELERVVLESGFSRIPVYEDTIDNIIGFIYTKTFFTAKARGTDFSIRDGLMPVKYFPDTITVADALSDLQKSKTHMAVVMDSYGGTNGIVTLEDLLEELVGEIWDEDDAVQLDVSATNGGKYIVKGNANVFDVMETIGIHFDPEEYDESSFSGFVTYKLERQPSKGDVIELENCTITVRTIKGRRVIDCEVTIKEHNEEAQEEN